MNIETTENEFSFGSRCVRRQIRLFSIHPGRGAEPLSLSMRYQNLDEDSPARSAMLSLLMTFNIGFGLLTDPASLLMQEHHLGDRRLPYMAISYSWGNPKDRVLVSCNENDLQITRSLHGALWRLREKGYTGQIWADAICINQQDSIEKTEQIRMMGDVYQKAEQVFIWLGEDEENDELGLVLMSSINALLEEDGPSITGRPTPDLSSDGPGLTQVPRECWNGLISLMQRPWFWRAWVVQEYLRACNRVFQCGPFEIPESLISGVSKRFDAHTGLKYVALINTDSKYRMNDSGSLFGPLFEFGDVASGNTSLTGLLSRARTLKSTDPKDRLFALVGLSSDTSTDFIDYTRDFDDLLREVTRKKFQTLLASPEPSAIFRYLCMVSKSDSTEGRSSWAVFFEHPAPFRGLGSLFATTTTLNMAPEVDLRDPKVLIKVLYTRAKS